MARVTYSIPNMICPACVMHLEELEDELPGILMIKASYQKQRMDVEFDEQRVSDQQIRAAVAELGYEISN
ncbi:MAG: heavy-metal-associated domain-containing protein [Chloroflexota bacterium]